MEIQTLIKYRSCYTTSDNDEVILRHDVVVVLVSTETYQPCIHKYCDFRYWWTSVAWPLTDQVKSDQVLKNIVTLELCYVKSWINVEKPRTYEVD